MPTPRFGPLKLRRDATGSVRVSAAPDRAPVVARAAAALAELSRRAGASGARPLDVQLVVQVRDAAGYARWRADREAIWRGQGGRFTTAGWPEALGAGLLAGVILPLPYGGATAVRGRQAPRVVGDPLFSTRSTADGSGPEDIALGLIAEWLSQAEGSDRPPRPAPPILESATGRRVLDLGLTWPLAETAGP
jgi:hypothetical protein